MKSWGIGFLGILFLSVSSGRAETCVIGQDFSQRIPAEGTGAAYMDSVELVVPWHGEIADLDVYLDITHTEVSDLLIYLVSPDNHTCQLKDESLMNSLWQGDRRANMWGTIFDDEADGFLPEGAPPYTGRYRPAAGGLDEFDGRDCFGVWTLRIYDLAYADIGSLDRWELRFELDEA
ncbi:MAG: proprotein convertase P-domain-containing protein, partial [Sedimentisphaerales bacterium]|nr:proprotein convertase P-domain-containing protein [Sedimentisphaerales bacterium]